MGRAVAQAAVRSMVVVFFPPSCDRSACFPQVAEPVRVQALVSEAAVEALDLCVLHRLSWLDMR